MDIYIIIVMIIVYFLVRIIPTKRKNNHLFINIAFMTLFIFLIIREPISDMGNYFKYFSFLKIATREQLLNFNLEIMYKILNVVIANIWYNERFFMFVIDVITSVGAYICIKRYSKNYLITLILFITIGTYYMQFFILRQAIAIGILLYSIKYIENKKFFRFTLCVLLATMFHKTSIVFLLAYIICNFEFNLKYLFLWGGILITIALSKNILSQFIMKYAHQEYMNNIISNEGYGRLTIFIVILLFALFIEYFIKRNEKNKEKKILVKRKLEDNKSIFYNLTLLTILFQILATQHSILSRAANIFCIGPVILLPNLISELENKQTKQIISVILIAVMMIYAILKPSILGYVTIFS